MRRFILAITRNLVSLAGATLTTIAAVLMLTLVGILLSGFSGGPYLGILTYMVLPGIFVTGLLLIPIGSWLDQRQAAKAAASGKPKPGFPVIDLNNDRTRQIALIVAALSTFNVVLIGVASFNAVHVMESTEFCGETCHSVMAPEMTTYKKSPHSRVPCVECHIGSGANWFVKSKLSGSWQLISVAFDLYERPISTPVHNLRPARDTCEQCHWPDKYVGDRLQVYTHFAEDEANTEKKSVILLRVGGIQGRESKGVHWHTDRDITIEYTADESREHIREVVMTDAEGKVTTYVDESMDLEESAAPRQMDCVDCHNRPTHIYMMPGPALDIAMVDGLIDRSMPFIKREGLAALLVEYDSHDAAREGIAAQLRGFYTTNHPDVASSDALDTAIDQVIDIYVTNVHPVMNITWGTYTNHIGHQDSPGCFRCHDGKHKTADGESIRSGCTTCHSLLAMQQVDPPILTQLDP